MDGGSGGSGSSGVVGGDEREREKRMREETESGRESPLSSLARPIDLSFEIKLYSEWVLHIFRVFFFLLQRSIIIIIFFFFAKCLKMIFRE